MVLLSHKSPIMDFVDRLITHPDYRWPVGKKCNWPINRFVKTFFEVIKFWKKPASNKFLDPVPVFIYFHGQAINQNSSFSNSNFLPCPRSNKKIENNCLETQACAVLMYVLKKVIKSYLSYLFFNKMNLKDWKMTYTCYMYIYVTVTVYCTNVCMYVCAAKKLTKILPTIFQQNEP
jgi:hypothetical protein